MIYDWSGQWLARQINILEGESYGNGSTIFSWNLAREMAETQLNTARAAFPEYDPTLWYGTRWTSYDAEYEDYYDAWQDGLTVTPSR
jgi:hypothetical protein